MPHTTRPPVEDDYQRLQERLDRTVTGAPDSPTFQRILRLLFTAEEAGLAQHIPVFTSVTALARRTGMAEEELAERVTTMARRGLVVDLELHGTRMVALAPVVIGLYEYTFMRTGDDAPTEELARLFEDYFDAGDLPRSVFRASTQLGRSLVREEALPDHPPVEVVDWERASAVVAGARAVAVAACPCRTHARLLGRACDAPVRTCLSFDGAAEAMVRAGLAEPITNDEAWRIVQECKAAGLAQTADDVRHGVSYLCNCCGCCCGMMRSIKRFDLPHGIVSSGWMASIDHDRCRGCGRCVTACPVGALHLEDTDGPGPRRQWAVLDPERCLGCGVCDDACRFGAHAMTPRAQRAWIPEDTMEQVVAMAIERGKLGDLLFDLTEARGPRAAAAVLQVLERTRPVRALAAIEPLRSAFLHAFVTALHAGR